jgi:iron-sulfur cluster repair protein YtfE (RIC family)
MHNLHIINYNDLETEELCHYLEERHYVQILKDFETTEKYLQQLNSGDEDPEITDLLNALFSRLNLEVIQLFTKDRILLFPHVKYHAEKEISLDPINQVHQRVMDLLQKLRGLMNNYVQKPRWSTQYKICCNELYALEQNIQHILYIKENFLWTKINHTVVK